MTFRDLLNGDNLPGREKGKRENGETILMSFLSEYSLYKIKGHP